MGYLAKVGNRKTGRYREWERGARYIKPAWLVQEVYRNRAWAQLMRTWWMTDRSQGVGAGVATRLSWRGAAQGHSRTGM